MSHPQEENRPDTGIWVPRSYLSDQAREEVGIQFAEMGLSGRARKTFRYHARVQWRGLRAEETYQPDRTALRELADSGLIEQNEDVLSGVVRFTRLGIRVAERSGIGPT